MPLKNPDTNAPDHPALAISLGTLPTENEGIPVRSPSIDRFTTASGAPLIASPSTPSELSGAAASYILSERNCAFEQLAQHMRDQAQRGFYPERTPPTPGLERWGRHVIEILMVFIGIFSAVYFLQPARGASRYLVNEVAGLEGVFADLLKGLLVASCVAINALFGAQCLSSAAATVLARNDSPSYTALCPKPPRHKRVLEHMLTSLGAVGYAAPSFALSLMAGGGYATYALAVLVALANLPVGYVGVRNLVAPRFRAAHSPHRTVFLSYLDERIHDLFTVREVKPRAMLGLIAVAKLLYFPGSPEEVDPPQTYQLSLLLEQLLNPAAAGYDTGALRGTEIAMQSPVATRDPVLIEATPIGLKRKIFRYIVTLLSVSSTGGYIWSAGHSLPTSSPGYIVGNVILALLSSSALLGLSYRSGLRVGSDLGAGIPSLAHSIYPRKHQSLLCSIRFAASFSGGSNFMVNKLFCEQALAGLGWSSLPAGASPGYQRALGTVYGAVGLIAAPIVNLYYAELLLNEAVELLAQYLDKSTHDYLALVRLYQTLHRVCSETTEEHFIAILRGLMSKPDTLSEPDALIKILLALFQTRLSADDYQALEAKLELPSVAVLNPSSNVLSLQRHGLFKTRQTTRDGAALEDSEVLDSSGCEHCCYHVSAVAMHR